MQDPYQILGIPHTASLDEVKHAYRRLARKYHPDVSTEPGAEEKFKEIQNAYDQIKNPKPEKPEFHGFNSDVFADYFNDRQPSYNIINIVLTLEECYTGITKTIQNRNIVLSPGVRNGTRLLADQQTIVHVSIKPHPRFQRSNDDLLVQTTVTVAEAMLGTTVEVAHINGKRYNVQVPSGVQSNQAVRVCGLGLPNPQFGNTGDLFVQFSINIPPINSLTEEQKQVIMSTGYRQKIIV